MLGRPGELDAIYEDALRGNPRARHFLADLEEVGVAAARAQAENVSSPECALFAVMRKCHTTWWQFEPLRGQGRGALRFLRLMQDAYEQRLRELAPQRRLNRSAMDMLMAAGPMGRATAAMEAEARGALRAAAERPPVALEREASTGLAAGASAPPTLEALERFSGLAREVLEAKLAEAEAAEPGPRISGEWAMLEKQRPTLERPPPGVPEGGLWREYVLYWEKKARAGKSPLTWEGYERLRGGFARGLAFQSEVTAKLRADAALPQAERTLLKDFRKPRVEQNVGVAKPGVPGVRFADQLVIDQESASGQPPRVETFSAKSRNLNAIPELQWQAQIKADAAEAVRSYGGTLDIRRPSLNVRGQPMRVSKVHLVYDAHFKPEGTKGLQDVIAALTELGVEVVFQ